MDREQDRADLLGELRAYLEVEEVSGGDALILRADRERPAPARFEARRRAVVTLRGRVLAHLDPAPLFHDLRVQVDERALSEHVVFAPDDLSALVAALAPSASPSVSHRFLHYGGDRTFLGQLDCAGEAFGFLLCEQPRTVSVDGLTARLTVRGLGEVWRDRAGRLSVRERIGGPPC